MLDVIAYQIPHYHATIDAWEAARLAIHRSVGLADAVVAISADAANWVELEGLAIDRARLFPVLLGVDHLAGRQEERIPQELLRRNFASDRFVLVLGANYGHKNRDLALAAVAELDGRGHDLAVVCAGAQVPHGSLRAEEARVLIDLDAGGHLGRDFILPDVDAEERNWLMHHAELVLYPTSAEGFGLVPFEAARFGTPTVHVKFGPLAELASDSPVSAVDWNPTHLADACERLLADPEVAEAQVTATLLQGSSLTWDRTAEELVRIYRDVLSWPSRARVF